MFEFDPQKTASKIEDFDIEVYKTVLTFFYQNRIESAKIDCQLFRAANFFLVPELFKICSQYLEENLNIWNVIEIMITADKINGSNNECKFLLDEDPSQFLPPLPPSPPPKTSRHVLPFPENHLVV